MLFTAGYRSTIMRSSQEQKSYDTAHVGLGQLRIKQLRGSLIRGRSLIRGGAGVEANAVNGYGSKMAIPEKANKPSSDTAWHGAVVARSDGKMLSCI